MNVIVNGRFLSHRVTGVERYASEIFRRLGDKPRVARPDKWAYGMQGHFWEQVTLPRLVCSNQLLWSPANTGPLGVIKQVLTLHDLSPLEHPEWFRASFALWYRLLLPVLARRVRWIVVPSDFVRAKLIRRFGLPSERVTTIPGGVDLSVFRPDAPHTLSLPPKYALFVGSLQPRKNLTGLLAAWARVKDIAPDAWLLIAGEDGNTFRPLALPKMDRVKFLGAVAEADLPGLYAGATLLVIPSRDEGFGLPVLEAMACGTPVAASTAGALPEVTGAAGLTFDPGDILGMAEVLRCLLTEKPLQMELREKGLSQARRFSWQSSADRLWEIFEACQ
jgi:glycosyltransferase involved in cell wall biosynthesis